MSDEQFEQAMVTFSRRLEETCGQLVRQHATKLRPNYDGRWIVNLQSQLQLFDKQQRGAGSTGASTSKRKSTAAQQTH